MMSLLFKLHAIYDIVYCTERGMPTEPVEFEFQMSWHHFFVHMGWCVINGQLAECTSFSLSLDEGSRNQKPSFLTDMNKNILRPHNVFNFVACSNADTSATDTACVHSKYESQSPIVRRVVRGFYRQLWQKTGVTLHFEKIYGWLQTYPDISIKLTYNIKHIQISWGLPQTYHDNNNC